MSVFDGPNVITNGLVLELDAANPKSYSGSGTTIFDLSGNRNHGTLVNGVGFNTNNGGILTFDGVDDYVTVSLNLQNTTYSIMGIARYTGVTSQRVISSNSGNWLMGWWAGRTNQYYAEAWVNNPAGTAETSWICYMATGNQPGDSWALYRNGNLIAGPNTNGSNGPNGIRLGGSILGEYSTCQVGCVLAYNRVLTDDEIQQNFNALRGRYGL